MWCGVVWQQSTGFSGEPVFSIFRVKQWALLCLQYIPPKCLISGWSTQWHITGDSLPHKFWVFENKNDWNIGSLLIFYLCFFYLSFYRITKVITFALAMYSWLLTLNVVFDCHSPVMYGVLRLDCCVPGGSGRTIWLSGGLKVHCWVKKWLLGVSLIQEIYLQQGVA